MFKTLGRKVYIPWGNQVVALEILAENPSQFEERNNVKFSENKSLVAEVREVFGENVTTFLGESLMTPSITSLEELGRAISTIKPITQKDIDFISNQYNHMLSFYQNEDINFTDHCKWIIDYNNDNHDSLITGFVGFIEIPNNDILNGYNQLQNIAFTSVDGRNFVPVYVFNSQEFQFDDKDLEFNDKKWIVFYHGTDNASYGKRFTTKEEADNFAALGFKAGLYPNKLNFFNS